MPTTYIFYIFLKRFWRARMRIQKGNGKMSRAKDFNTLYTDHIDENAMNAYSEKYDRLWQYDTCVCGTYIIPKSECDTELMNLILEFLSDNYVERQGDGGYAQYMLMSRECPFYNKESDEEHWVDCWVLSDEYTY